MNAKPAWSPGMRFVWWGATVVVAATVIVLLASAIEAFVHRGTLEWRSLFAVVAPMFILGWLISVKRHPEEWLDGEGKSRFRW